MRWAFILFAALICAACAGPAATPLAPTGTVPAMETSVVTVEALPVEATPIRPTLIRPTAAEAAPTAAPTPTYDMEAWKTAPVLPELSPHALSILQAGIERGYNPHAFSKIGDCESRTTWFLGSYDLGPEHYTLGPYEAELAPVIDYYSGSFNRLSLAARQGFTAASLLSPIWADREFCQKNETPLACEYRIHKPLVAFILVGTNDATNPKTFEGHMRRAIEYSLAQNILPILGTKADNIEGNHEINTVIARLAYSYDVPLWNYWGAVQGLPGHGLQEDGAHLTFAAPFFDDPQTLQRAWPVRNLNALQVLRIVMDVTP